MNILPALALSLFINAPVAVLAQENATAPGTIIELPGGLKEYRLDTIYVNSGVVRKIGYSYPVTDSSLAIIQRCWLRVYNLERANELQWEDKNLPKPTLPDPEDSNWIKAEYDWIPPRTGHYYYEVSCCTGAEDATCTGFASTLNATDTRKGRAFWLFSWPAPPEF